MLDPCFVPEVGRQGWIATIAAGRYRDGLEPELNAVPCAHHRLRESPPSCDAVRARMCRVGCCGCRWRVRKLGLRRPGTRARVQGQQLVAHPRPCRPAPYRRRRAWLPGLLPRRYQEARVAPAREGRPPRRGRCAGLGHARCAPHRALTLHSGEVRRSASEVRDRAHLLQFGHDGP